LQFLLQGGQSGNFWLHPRSLHSSPTATFLFNDLVTASRLDVGPTHRPEKWISGPLFRGKTDETWSWPLTFI